MRDFVDRSERPLSVRPVFTGPAAPNTESRLTRGTLRIHDRSWHIASFPCAAESGRYRGNSGL
jgi:hypothetical protein